jgi:DNA-binding GntR family transcriptional regulator
MVRPFKQTLILLSIGGGSVVKALNTKQISESLALLIRTQNVSLNHLAEKTDIQVLKELLEEARACIEMGSSHRDTFIDIDKQIHLTLAKITGNPIYQFLMYSVHENIHRYYDRYLSMEERELNENYQDLCNIVNAVEQGHVDEACLLAQNHVHRFNRYMKNRARQQQKGTS